MSFSPSEVEKIAYLARIAIQPQDIPGYADNLSKILTLVEQMNAVDTTGVEPMAHPLDLPARLRADEILETNQREAFQSIAPLVENGLYLVPRVIE